jgi:glycine oxidase
VSPDVGVIGAGVVGLAIARELARGGADVVVFERDEPGMQASWAAAGMLAPQSEADEPGEFFDLLLRSRERYADFVADLESETGVAVGYRADGMLVLAFDERDEAEITKSHEWQQRAGMLVERLTASEARALEPGLSRDLVSAIRFPGDHQVDNRQLTRAIRASAEGAGASFRVGSMVRGIAAVGAESRIELQDGSSFDCAKVVLAAGSWSGLIAGLPAELPVEPVHGQLLSVESGAPFLRHLVAWGPRYIVPRADGRLIVGTTVEKVGFRQGVTVAGLRSLAEGALRLVPGLADRPPVAHWSGLRPGTPDGLPILGPDPDQPDLLYATGHYRNGILLAPLTAELIRSLVFGESPSVDLSPYRRNRF